MAKGAILSKTLAATFGILTISAVCGVVLLLVVYQIQISKNPPVRPPTPVPTKPVPGGPPPSLRLPDNWIPEHYKVFIQTYLYGELTNTTEQSFYFKGNSTVRLQCVKDSRSIFLHVQDLNVTDVTLTHSNTNKKISVNRHIVHDNESNFLEIQLNTVLEGNGTYYELFTAFEGELREDLSGFYVSQYEVDGEKRFLATTQLQPTDARGVFPCFDEPALKAVFELTVIHREGFRALSNTRGVDEYCNIDEERWVKTVFPPTPVMSTYLLAITVSDFIQTSQSNNPEVLTFARPDAIGAGHADYATEAAVKILKHYEKMFELKYPLEQLKQIALPDFGEEAMENWGLISYREPSLLYEEGTSSNFDKEWVTTLIAHELAHQWFGNLVTMRWWNDIWLNEGFATYMSYFGVEAAGYNLRDLFVLREMQTAFQSDSLNSSHPLSMNESHVQTFSDIIELFDDVTYSKGAAVLRMLSVYIGEEAFMKGIKTYLQRFQYNNTEYTDLWKCLDELTAKDVSGFMSTWIEEVGYPVVTIITQGGEISQEQFLLKQTEGHGIAWHVPIKYMKSKSFQIEEFLLRANGPVKKPDMDLTGEDVWLLVNINCTGFYRVNYDEENWNKLLDQLEYDHHVIPVINRGQLIDDAFNLARADRLNVTISLRTTKYLINETEYIPWESAIRSLDHFILMFDRSEVYGPMRKYLRQQVEHLYDHLKNYTENGNVPESHTDQFNQVNAISVACSNGLPECIEMAKNLFKEYRNGTNLIHPNLRETIYCNAIAAGDEEDWEFAWNEYQIATVPAEKDKLRYALSCTKQIWLLNRLLQYTLDPEKIRKMDLVSTVNFIAKNVAGQALAWDFVRGQWSYITQEYGISLGTLLDGVTKRFSTDVELQQLRQLQMEQEEEGQDLAGRALEQVIERTEANIVWVRENKEAVLDWFRGEL